MGERVDEASAARVAAQWIPQLYEQRIFPIFLMWETGFLTTVMNRLEDAIARVPRTTGAGGALERWWNERIERLLSRPGTLLWAR